MKFFFTLIMAISYISCDAPHRKRYSDYGEFGADANSFQYNQTENGNGAGLDEIDGQTDLDDIDETPEEEFQKKLGYENCEFDFEQGDHNSNNSSWTGKIALCRNQNNSYEISFKTSKNFNQSEFCLVPLNDSGSNGHSAIYGQASPHPQSGGYYVNFISECSYTITADQIYTVTFDSDLFYNPSLSFNSLMLVKNYYANQSVPNLFSCLSGMVNCSVWAQMAFDSFMVIDL